MALVIKSSDSDLSPPFSILRDYLQAESPPPPADIANRIDRYHEKGLEGEKKIPKEERDKLELDPDGCYGPLWEIWIAFIVIVEQVPHDHPAQNRLINVIRGMRELPGRKVDLEGPISTDDAQKWRNVTSFLARCWGAEFFNASRQAVLLLCAALEEPVEDTSALQQILPVACEWIEHSQAAFTRIIESGADEEGHHKRTGTLYEGPNKLCQERWQFWKGRFGELAGQAEGEAKDLALSCVLKMSSIS
ncbi:hypothetical protein N7532_009310 [Penicillium argentinense]|uniref:Uncharacterized protein n=1 Tax=Penicillium argentinense TaxID=1131581 RepID=A0A9W9EZ88_9EURO|nr:uncharacterized protein N7532_009310 [Penicillium argentinense]KAJ5090626.1 hypothetical protein N7532_009310 [Penicillium argentinense]